MKKLILEYHLVDYEYNDFNNINIFPENFEQQMEFLNQNFRIVNYDKILEEQDSDEDEVQVALTFDDCFSGFYKFVYPVLHTMNIPAIIFPVTDYLSGQTEHWMNELHRLILLGDKYPDHFCVNHPLYRYQFETENFSQRLNMYKVLRVVLQKMNVSIKERCNILSDLQKWSYTDKGNRLHYLPINLKECKIIAQDKLITFGAHTKSHSALRNMGYTEQFLEIYDSKKILENILGIQIKHFSYPFGSFDTVTKQTLRKLNFSSACGIQRDCFAGLDYIDKYELPRLAPPNKGKDGFRRWINDILGTKEENVIENSFISYMGKLENDNLLRENKKVLIFGAGDSGAFILQKMQKLGLDNNMAGFIDNDESKKGSIYCGYEIFLPEQLRKDSYYVCVWKYSTEILNQLKNMGIGNIHLLTEI